MEREEKERKKDEPKSQQRHHVYLSLFPPPKNKGQGWDEYKDSRGI
jgi:hypothetical protein